MKILHVCLTGTFTDGMLYQENELVNCHVMQGHDVIVIASTEIFNEDKKIINTSAGCSKLSNGATLIRLPYAFGVWGWLASKIRAYTNLMPTLEAIKPERIMFHGLAAWDLLTVSAYVRQNPKVKLFVDCHGDFNNSAKSLASRELLHKRFYKPIFHKCINQINEILCITVESLDFAVNFYGSPPEKTRLFPLGCNIESPEIVDCRRFDFRARYGFKDTDIIIAQTGKLDRTKKLEEVIYSFRANPSPNLYLVIAGKMSDDVKSVCLPLIKTDPRILDLGWQTADELRIVLAGADCFLQPFGQTVTTQVAMGYGCVILAQDLPSHRWLIAGGDFLFKDVSELPKVFKRVVDNKERLGHMGRVNSQFATSHLDYKQLALQITS